MSLDLVNINTTPFTGALEQHFLLFSKFRNLVIHKSPKKTVTTLNSPSFYGYEENQQNTIVTLTPVTGSYPCVVEYRQESADESLPNIGNNNPAIKTEIKVKEDAKDFIESRETEKLELDGRTFNIIGGFRQRNYLGLIYYQYVLEETN